MRFFPLCSPVPPVVKDSSMTSPSILFLCERWKLAALPLVALARAGANILGVWGRDISSSAPVFMPAGMHGMLRQATHMRILPDDRGVLLDAVHVSGLASLAQELDIPCKLIPTLSSMAVPVAAKSLAPDLIVTVGTETPPTNALRDIPRLGWLNLHLSALPDFAGADPTFWELRRGRSVSGVCVHTVGQELWNGNSIAIETLTFKNARAWEERIALKLERGATLLANTAMNFAPSTGTAITPSTINPPPSGADWNLTPDMTCAAIESFVGGFGAAGRVGLILDGQRLAIDGLTQSNPNERSGKPGDRARAEQGRIRYRCADGWVTLTTLP